MSPVDCCHSAEALRFGRSPRPYYPQSARSTPQTKREQRQLSTFCRCSPEPTTPPSCAFAPSASLPAYGASYPTWNNQLEPAHTAAVAPAMSGAHQYILSATVHNHNHKRQGSCKNQNFSYGLSLHMLSERRIYIYRHSVLTFYEKHMREL